jgi:anti-sigma factor RsiW
MNCFEARKEFISFWRRTMPEDERVRFSAHLNECGRCDRSFRVFALTAPALHSETEPEGDSAAYRPMAAARPAVRRDAPEESAWRVMTAALAMAAAAAIAVYVAIPSRTTFMDAIAVENPNVDQVSYTAADSVFGQELFGQDVTQQSLRNQPAADDLE